MMTSAGALPGEFIAGDFFRFCAIVFSSLFLAGAADSPCSIDRNRRSPSRSPVACGAWPGSVCAEDVVHNEKEHQQAEESAPMLAAEKTDFLACIRLVQFFKTHADASRVSSAEAPRFRLRRTAEAAVRAGKAQKHP